MMENIAEILPELIGLFFCVLVLFLFVRDKIQKYNMSEEEKQKVTLAQEKYAKEYYDKYHTSNGQICCPKCRSQQIQIVQRKWSIFSGLLTNKIDRACLNCKNRF